MAGQLFPAMGRVQSFGRQLSPHKPRSLFRVCYRAAGAAIEARQPHGGRKSVNEE